MTWAWPYRVGQGTNKQIRVEEATLTIEPGVTLRFEPGAGIEAHHQNADEESRAALVAVGTAEKPIVFTSASATPAPGAWVGLWFGGHPRGETKLDHVKIEYAGGDCLCGLAMCSDITEHDAAILMHYQPSPRFAITNSTIAHRALHAINGGWQGSSVQSFRETNTFTDVEECVQTLPVPENGTCPDPKPACD